MRSIIDRNYQRSTRILKENEPRLHVMASALIRYETIDVEQIKDIMEGREPRPSAGLVGISPPPGGDSPVVEDEDDGEQSPSGSGSIGGPARPSLTNRAVAPVASLVLHHCPAAHASAVGRFLGSSRRGGRRRAALGIRPCPATRVSMT